MDIAVGIINWNSGHWLKGCVASVLGASNASEIAVIDNASSDDSLKNLQGMDTDVAGFSDRVKIYRNTTNLGFAAGVNHAFAVTSAPFVLILNPDIGVLPGAVDRLQRVLIDHPRAGAVGGHVGERYLPRRFPTVSSLVRENLGFGKRKSGLHGDEPCEVEQPAAAALLVRRTAFQEAGGFDDRFFPAWYEDVDFCRRLNTAGWKIYFDPGARFLHEGGYSAKALGTSNFAAAYYRNQLRYVARHMNAVAGFTIRCSIAAGMLARALASPSNAAAYWTVFRGALGSW